jgi:hypothetical protein
MVILVPGAVVGPDKSFVGYEVMHHLAWAARSQLRKSSAGVLRCAPEDPRQFT